MGGEGFPGLRLQLIPKLFLSNLAGWLAPGWLAGWLAVSLAGWLAGWQSRWLAGWLAGWQLSSGSEPQAY